MTAAGCEDGWMLRMLRKSKDRKTEEKQVRHRVTQDECLLEKFDSRNRVV